VLPVLLSGLDRASDLGCGLSKRLPGRQDVDPDLVLTPPSALSTGRSRAAGAVLAVVLLLLVAVSSGWPGLFLVACVLVGFGISYLSGLPLTCEERLAFGAVIGALSVSLLDLLLALFFGL